MIIYILHLYKPIYSTYLDVKEKKNRKKTAFVSLAQDILRFISDESENAGNL